ncbi:MAG: autotransporter-associated beta strand repeat-containing protein [Verrucomicrobiales bacterium]|nr:autotransporter-associated beta strand repeat-containing protein [Verrucomicrobiales bacterium]
MRKSAVLVCPIMCLFALPGVLRAQNLIYSGSSTAGDGAVLHSGTGITVSNTISGTLAYTNNTAGGKGGAWSSQGADPTLLSGSYGGGVLFTGNTAGGNGGAIHDEGGSITLNLVAQVLNLSNNTSSGGAGGAVYANNGAVTIGGTFSGDGWQSVTVISNTAAGGSGGAVYSSGTFTLRANARSNFNFDLNYASQSGGAVYVNNGDIRIADSRAGQISISQNTANSGNGGAFYASGGINFDNVTTDVLSIEDNHASGNGGAFYAGNGNISFSGTITDTLYIMNNSAGGNGGAFYVNNGRVAFSDDGGRLVLISNNTAGQYGGAFYSGQDFSLHVADNVTLLASGNKAAANDNGGFLFVNQGNVTFDIGTSGTAVIGDTTSIANQADSIGGWGAALYKTGAGTLVLYGSNSYAGNTYLNAGKTLIHGSIYGDNAYQSTTVADGAILGGNGRVNGNTTVQSGGIITAGDIGASGTLTVGNLTLASGANAVFDLASSTLYDRLLTGGTIQLVPGVVVTINILDGFDYQEGRVYVFDLMQGVTGDYTGDLAWGNIGRQWSVQTGNATFINGTLTFQVTQVPEPSTWLLFGIGTIIFAICSLHQWRANHLK